MKMYDFLKRMNDYGICIDYGERKQAVVIYNGELYFGLTHGGIVINLLENDDFDKNHQVVYRPYTKKYKRTSKIAFGEVINEEVGILFDTTQTFFPDENEEEKEEEFYSFEEISKIMKTKKEELKKMFIDKVYTIEREDICYGEYLLDTLKEVF